MFARAFLRTVPVDQKPFSFRTPDLPMHTLPDMDIRITYGRHSAA
jgi:hypothetical protein